jgi:hypothetical protein
VILRHLILLAIVLAGLAVSAGVVVVGLVYSAYAVIEPRLGPAGAAGVMVGVAAIVLGGAAGALFIMSRPKKVVVAPTPSPIAAVIDSLSDVVRERPVVVLLAAVGAGVLAVRNPRYLASALRAFVAPRTAQD